LRGEYRQRGYDLFGEDFRDNIFSLGLQLPFGSAGRTVVDTDGDGVPDSIDRCPGTAPGTDVDNFGCERDSDGDGVHDGIDRCPGTPAGVSVNADGCPQDSDGDGVHGGAGRWPHTPPGGPAVGTGGNSAKVAVALSTGSVRAPAPRPTPRSTSGVGRSGKRSTFRG